MYIPNAFEENRIEVLHDVIRKYVLEIVGRTHGDASRYVREHWDEIKIKSRREVVLLLQAYRFQLAAEIEGILRGNPG
jgi:hypothetical protein